MMYDKTSYDHLLNQNIPVMLLTDLYVAWWNLENLFDTETASRTDKLTRQLKDELKGWTQAILNKKLTQLASIIEKMNDDQGPDILGVCEVENKIVLEKLIDTISSNRHYEIAHDDAKDERGIDVAFIYDSDKFTFKDKFSHAIVKRSATRDIFQINLKIKRVAQDIVLIGNHWPSRSGGTYESAPYRMMAGENLAYFHQRIVEENDENIPIIAMGDFNDEPFDRSLLEYALSMRTSDSLKRAINPKFYNLMWSLLGAGSGTHHFGSEFSMLDQFMISKGLLFGNSKAQYKKDSVAIESRYFTKKKPDRFGRPSTKLNEQGYSDHFPISMVVELT